MPTVTPIVAVGPSGPGALAGFESRCSCGLVMRSSIEVNVALDVRAHLAWHAASNPRCQWLARCRNTGTHQVALYFATLWACDSCHPTGGQS